MNLDAPTIFRHRQVRDLAWAIGSSNLVTPEANPYVQTNSFVKELYQQSRDWLLLLDETPRPLFQFLEQRQQRHNKLGLYFEDLWLFWLQEQPGIELLAHDFQVFRNKETIGAFDFILEREEQTEHWEIAIKLYLGIHNSSNWIDWVGPGKRDRLSIKLNKMFDTQIELSSTPEGTKALTDIGITPIAQRRIFIKGFFFQQWKEKTLPNCTSSDCNIGIWIQQKEIDNFIRQFPFTYRFVKRNKPNWLSTEYLPRTECEDIRELSNFASTRDLPFLISILKGRQIYKEIQRVFIVPDSWFS